MKQVITFALICFIFVTGIITYPGDDKIKNGIDIVLIENNPFVSAVFIKERFVIQKIGNKDHKIFTIYFYMHKRGEVWEFADSKSVKSVDDDEYVKVLLKPNLLQRKMPRESTRYFINKDTVKSFNHGKYLFYIENIHIGNSPAEAIVGEHRIVQHFMGNGGVEGYLICHRKIRLPGRSSYCNGRAMTECDFVVDLVLREDLFLSVDEIFTSVFANFRDVVTLEGASKC